MMSGGLDITIIGAEKLKNVKLIGHQRPYVICQVGAVKAESKVCSASGKNPIWNVVFKFNVTTERTAFITICNKRRLMPDTVIGNVDICLNKVLLEGFDSVSLPVLTAIGDPCCGQLMTEKGFLKAKLSFSPWKLSRASC